MKNIKYILVLLIGVVVFAACDDNAVDGTIYHANNNEASFPSETSSYTFGAEDPEQFEVTIQRASLSGAVSVPVTATDASGLFTIPQSVDFADGAYEAKFVIAFNRDNLKTGEAYPITLDLPANPVVTKTISHAVTITRDYVWEPYLTGTFESGFFEDKWEQALDKAVGVERYKFTDLFASGYDFIFEVSEDGIITPAVKANSSGTYTVTTGYMHSSYGMVYMEFDPDPEYSLCDWENKEIKLNSRYFVGAGSFGWLDDVFTWE